MEEKEEVVNINFFKKVWYSITKFEQYPAMATEGVKRAIKYLVMLTAIVSIFVMIGSLLQMKTLISDVQDSIPEFSYSEGNLSMETEEIMVIKDAQYSGIDRVVIDTLSETDEQKEQVEKDNLINGITIFFFKNEIILKTKSEDDQILRQPYTYSDFIANYTGENIEQFDKTDFVQFLTSEKMTTFYAQYAVAIFIYLLIIITYWVTYFFIGKSILLLVGIETFIRTLLLIIFTLYGLLYTSLGIVKVLQKKKIIFTLLSIFTIIFSMIFG